MWPRASVRPSCSPRPAYARSPCCWAAASGVPRTGTCRTEEELQGAVRGALAARELSCLVAKVEPQGPASYFIDLHFLESRFQFQRHLRSLVSPAGPAGPAEGAADEHP